MTVDDVVGLLTRNVHRGVEEEVLMQCYKIVAFIQYL
jgi:hypothetical protein